MTSILQSWTNKLFQVEEAESADPNAGIHGNWTMENAKSFLHQFIQTRHIRTDYVYSMMGRSFVAEMRFYVNELRREVVGRETASNKASASKSCALSIVRQLFHLGVIEAFSGTLKKNKSVDEVAPYEVAVSPELVSQLESCLQAEGLESVQLQSDLEEPLSLLPAQEKVPAPPSLSPGIVTWSPPTPNWNPWQGCNIDEGPLATASMDDICSNLSNDLSERSKTCPELMGRKKERDSLPIAASRAQILECINNSSVVLVRGNTGCGKTTQVCQYILDDWVAAGQGAHCNIICTQVQFKKPPCKILIVSFPSREEFLLSLWLSVLLLSAVSNWDSPLDTVSGLSPSYLVHMEQPCFALLEFSCASWKGASGASVMSSLMRSMSEMSTATSCWSC